MSLDLMLPLFGLVPPPAPPVTSTITLSPADPGDLGTAPANWTTHVTATGGLTQVKWRVGIPGAKTIVFPMGVPNNTTVPGYNHGDVINFTGYGTGFTIAKDASGPNAFFVQGSLGFDTFNIGTETSVADIRYTVDGAGGTGALTYTLVNLTAGQADIIATFTRAGDRLIVKDTGETTGFDSGPVAFNGVASRSIALTPHDPGDLGTPPVNWTTRVNAVGMTQVQWIVLDQNWVGRRNLVVTNLVNGTALITCDFVKVGERLVVQSLDATVEDVSGQVAFSGVVTSISLSPQNPGNLGTAPANWNTTVTTTGLPQVKWAVMNADGSFVGNWTTVNVSSIVNSVAITAQFTAPGQSLVVRSLNDQRTAQSGAVSFGTVVGGNDLQFANDFVKNLTMGANLERGTAVPAPVSYFQQLRVDGQITHLRLYTPSRLDWGPPVSESRVNQFADTIQNAIAAGLKILFECTDVIDLDQAQNPTIIDFVDMCCRVFSARNIDPRMMAFGSINEMADWTNDNTNYNPIRRMYYEMIRGYFPNHIVLTSSASWSAWEAMVDPSLEVFPDKRVIYKWNSYPWNADDPNAMADIQAAIDDFKNIHNVVTINGELGKDGGSGGLPPEVQPSVIYASSRGAWRERITMWAITGGSFFRLNNDTDNNLRPDTAAAYRDADNYIRSQPGFGT